MKKSGFFRDILKSQVEGNLKYSQGRVYLLLFVIIYVALLAYYTFVPSSLSQPIIDAIQWGILVFAFYVFGTNGLSATKDIFKIKNGNGILPNISNGTTTPAVTTTTKQPSSDVAPKVIAKEEDLST